MRVGRYIAVRVAGCFATANQNESDQRHLDVNINVKAALRTKP